MAFIHMVGAEWLKRKRSLTTWLVIGSAAFVPTVVFASRVFRSSALTTMHADPAFWQVLWRQTGEAMAVMILPFAAMLMVSLITQIEDRANGWKQLHAAPVSMWTIFVSKFVVICALIAATLLLFTGAVWLVGVLPPVFVSALSRPVAPFPWSALLWRDAVWFVDTLPIIAVQYALALRFRTFVAPMAIGLALWITSIGMMSWHYAWVLPYSALPLDYLNVEYGRAIFAPLPISAIAMITFAVSLAGGGAAFGLRKDRG